MATEAVESSSMQSSAQADPNFDAAALLEEISNRPTLVESDVRRYVEEQGLVPLLQIVSDSDSNGVVDSGPNSFVSAIGYSGENVDNIIQNSTNSRDVMGAYLLKYYGPEIQKFDGTGALTESNQSGNLPGDLQRVIDNQDAATSTFSGMDSVFSALSSEEEWNKVMGGGSVSREKLAQLDTSRMTDEQKAAVQTLIDNFDYFESGPIDMDIDVGFSDIQRRKEELRKNMPADSNGVLDTPETEKDGYATTPEGDNFETDMEDFKRDEEIRDVTNKHMDDRENILKNDNLSFQVQDNDTIWHLVNKQIKIINELAGKEVMQAVPPGPEIYSNALALDIARYNDITNLDVISTGQTITLPKSILEKYVAGPTKPNGPR